MSIKKPSVRQFEYFDAVARASNFRKAAEKLGMSQPALTQQIAELEDLLDVQLFDRSRAGTLLTVAGRNMLPLVKELLDQYQEVTLFADASKNHDLVGRFKIGILPAIGPVMLSAIIPELHERYPLLQLHIQEAFPRDLERGLDDGRYDLILTLLPMQIGKHRTRPLFTEEVKVVMHSSNPLSRKTRLRARDLHQQPMLALEEQLHLQKQIQAVCDRYGATLLKGLETNSLVSMLLMLKMNMGLGLLPNLFLTREITEADNLKVFSLEDESLTRTYIAVWRKNASARYLFQKLSFEIKTLAMDHFGTLIEEVVADENLPETW